MKLKIILIGILLFQSYLSFSQQIDNFEVLRQKLIEITNSYYNDRTKLDSPHLEEILIF